MKVMPLIFMPKNLENIKKIRIFANVSAYIIKCFAYGEF